jgi:ribosomal protein S14
MIYHNLEMLCDIPWITHTANIDKYILNMCRHCFLQQVIEGKIEGGIEVKGRQRRRCRKLLDDLKERREYSHLKVEDLDHTMRKARFGRGLGPVMRQTTKRMNSIMLSNAKII